MKLSICIPTYNFGAFIGETLESIVSQLTPEVEVVVFDGGSTDDTEAVVRRFMAPHFNLRYVRQPYRGGIDRDMARSVDLARGEYCWLFSADDIMHAGATARLVAETVRGLDLYLLGMTLCDRNMVTIAGHPILDAAPGTVYDLGDAAQRHAYFACAQTTVALFSFMGAIVIRRDRWQMQSLDEPYVGTCWAHVVRILKMIPHGLTVNYVGASMLRKRSDNDSFMNEGLVHRYGIAVYGYHRIADDIFGHDSVEARHIRRVIVNEFSPKYFLAAKLDCMERGRWSDLPELDRLVRIAYSDRNARNFLYQAVYRLLPLAWYKWARTAAHRVRWKLRT